MNLILLSNEDMNGSGKRAVITGRRYKHIRDFLKPVVGDRLLVGMIGGRIGTGLVSAIDGRSMEMDILLDQDPPAPVNGTLILAMPRPIVFNRLLGHITALGIKRVVLVHSKRVEKSYWSSPVLKEGSIKDHLILGLEQARDTILPEVLVRMDLRSFVGRELPSIIKGTSAFVAHPETEKTIPCGVGAFTLVIGPEGGFLPDEVDAFKAAGCKSVNLGKRILRVETAVVAALSRLASF